LLDRHRTSLRPDTFIVFIQVVIPPSPSLLGAQDDAQARSAARLMCGCRRSEQQRRPSVAGESLDRRGVGQQ
jgi:hypothetical protein